VLDFFGTIGGAIMAPLYYAVSFILVGFHRALSTFMDPAGGWTWVLSIVGLTLVVRTALIPLFVKQIKSSRNMQLIQPKVRELQKKYGHDREKLAQETMKLYKDSGTNPFASCLPILLQMPIFLALFRMLDQAARKGKAHGFMDTELANQFRDATFLGNIKVSGTFMNADNAGVMVVAAILVVAMTATTFLTQRQLMSKNMPADALSGPYAQQQKLLLYVLPVVFAVGGIAFPIGVLVYWTISNLWTMGQQFYVIRNNPAPGTPAAQAKEERDRHKAERKGLKTPAQVEEERLAAEAEAKREEKAQARVQPQRQTKAQRNKKKR
jgi:YidC/Oxa1 family membrane protein insertase